MTEQQKWAVLAWALLFMLLGVGVGFCGGYDAGYTAAVGGSR